MKFSDTKYGDLTGQVYNGSIDVSGLGLTSLEGAPKEVIGYFDCSDNQLTSLKDAPEKVKGFYCFNNRLTSFRYSPKEIVYSAYYHNNQIKSLEYLNFHKNILSDFSDREINEYYKTNFPQYLI